MAKENMLFDHTLLLFFTVIPMDHKYASMLTDNIILKQLEETICNMAISSPASCCDTKNWGYNGGKKG